MQYVITNHVPIHAICKRLCVSTMCTENVILESSEAQRGYLKYSLQNLQTNLDFCYQYITFPGRSSCVGTVISKTWSNCTFCLKYQTLQLYQHKDIYILYIETNIGSNELFF